MKASSLARRHRTALLIGAALLATLVLGVLTSDRSVARDPLDPAGTDLAGAGALASVLADHGVDVDTVRSADALGESAIDQRTTVVVTSAHALGVSTIRRLRTDAEPGHLVLIDPTPLLAREFELEGPFSSPAGERTGDCADSRFNDLEMLALDATEYAGAMECFPGPEGGLLTQLADGTLILGAGEVLSNDGIVYADHAAIGLRLLGQRPHVVWYVPNATDLVGSDASQTLGSILPPWLRPALVLIAIAVFAQILWRGRRLGALLVEPLPVSVKAIETTTNLGRSYRAVGDRAHAATTLRRATRRRLSALVQLPSGADESALLAAVAERTRRESDALAQLIGADGSPPANDDQLILLANQLTELEEEVRRP